METATCVAGRSCGRNASGNQSVTRGGRAGPQLGDTELGWQWHKA